MGAIYTTGPNKALVISGGCLGGQRVKTVIGGWAWAWACLHHVQELSLEVITLNPTCKNVETTEGVPLTVTGVAQVKIMSNEDFLPLACEQFLDLSIDRIQNTILQTMEGHLRAILGTLTVEQIYKDRDQFATLVREVAAPDVGRMGIEVLSFTIKDVYDDVNYLGSLGKPQIAIVKRNAAIGEAYAERDAGISEKECERLHMETRCKVDASIADFTREYEGTKASYDVEVNAAKAGADLAYQLQAAKEKQLICDEEVKVEIVEQGKKIEIEEQEVIRHQRVLQATVEEPANAEAYRISTIAAGEREKTKLAAHAAADGVRLVGDAKAKVIEAMGDAESKGLRLKAEAYAEFNNAAKLKLLLDQLPALAAEVCAPLAKTTEIVMVGEGAQQGGGASLAGLGRSLIGLSATLPPAVRATTGIDLTNCIARLPGATTVNS